LKFFILIYYFFRSLILRGPFAHFRLLFGEWHYERKYGIQTSGFKTSDSKQHHHYQAASYTVLNLILQALPNKSRDYAFYDIGCGKGRVLFMASQLGHKNLYGIELDKVLLEDAKKNLQPLLLKNVNTRLQLIQKNVLEYRFEDQPSVYFLFNPFNAEVMEGFIENVLNTNKHECYMIYMNPLFSRVFTQKNIRVYRTIRSFLYKEAIIYHLPALTP